MSTLSSAAQKANARSRMLLLALPHRSRGRAVLAAAALLAAAAAAGYATHSSAEKKKRAARHRRGHHSHAARALSAAASPSHGSKSASAALAAASNTAIRQRRPPPAFWPTMRYLIPLARPKLAALLALAIARTAVANRLARVQGYMFRAAFLRQVPLFARDFAENVFLCLVAAGIESTVARVASSVSRDWRSALTKQVHASYFDGMTYYKLAAVDRSHGISNPEARICEDVPRFADGAAGLARETLVAVVDAAFFSRELRSYSGTNKYTLAILAYIFGAGGATMGAAPNFGKMIKRQADLEGSYRHLHARLAANAEPVAFYGGVEREGVLVRGAFGDAARHAAHVIGTQWRFAMLQDFTTKYAAATVAVVLIIGPFFRGDLRPGEGVTGRASMLANMRYHTNVIISLFTALGNLAQGPRKAAKLGAHADRVAALQRAADDVSGRKRRGSGGSGRISSSPPAAPPLLLLTDGSSSAPCASSSPSSAPSPAPSSSTSGGTIEAWEGGIEFDHCDVVTPSGATLVRDLCLRVPAGTNLLVTGPNGAGKSSLFRVLGGLWPLSAGVVRKPGSAAGVAASAAAAAAASLSASASASALSASSASSASAGLASDIFYVPQRPYVTVGTLQDQIIYPRVRSPGEPDVVPETQLKELLDAVDLGHLLEREFGFGADAVVDWGAQLSLGEQQRLGMARLFFHRPRFAILDECTSGVTTDMEARFCAAVRNLGCSCVTISHRPALVAFHDLVLALDGEGGWSVHEGMRRKQGGGGSGGVLTSGGGAGGGDKAKRRGDDAGACFEGMNAAAAAAEAERGGGSDADSYASSADAADGGARLGRLLASSPPPGTESARALELALRPLCDQLKPSAAGSPEALWPRWKRVLCLLLPSGGSGGGESGSSRSGNSGSRSGNSNSSSRKRRRGGGTRQVAAILAVVAARSLLQDRMSALNGKTVEYVLRQDLKSFTRLIGLSIAQAAASAVLAPSLRALGESLALSWRAQLTAALHRRLLKGRTTLYTVRSLSGISDFDARATRDVERLCADLAELIPCLVKPVFDLAWFSSRMWALTRARGMAVLYLYAAIGFGCLRALTPDFSKMSAEDHRLEGAFRGSHARLRSHAESVAFFGGGAREAATVGARFSELLRHSAALARARWAHAVADDFFSKQLPHNVTWALTVLYALDHSPKDSSDVAAQGRLVYDMRYLAGVVTACFSAFGELLALNKRLAELGGGVGRVAQLLEAVESAERLHLGAEKGEAGEMEDEARAAAREPLTSEEGGTPAAAAKERKPLSVDTSSSSVSSTGKDLSLASPGTARRCIEFDGVDVVTPAGKLLARRLAFAVTPGRSLLVTGPNGSGKSSIFRVLGGLWPLVSGTVKSPSSAGGESGGGVLDTVDVFYVPQRPYTTIGTLREQITYPLSTRAAAAKYGKGHGTASEAAALDAELDSLARVVRLSYLVEREGGWGAATAEWGEVLSLGEQQRLGMARLFFHRPAFGVLDECTNATSVDVEAGLYEHAASLGITLVTVTQRAALLRHHSAELALSDGKGAWTLREIEQGGGSGSGGKQQQQRRQPPASPRQQQGESASSASSTPSSASSTPSSAKKSAGGGKPRGGKRRGPGGRGGGGGSGAGNASPRSPKAPAAAASSPSTDK